MSQCLKNMSELIFTNGTDPKKTGKDRNMTKPQSHENATHVIIGSQNTPLLM